VRVFPLCSAAAFGSSLMPLVFFRKLSGRHYANQRHAFHQRRSSPAAGRLGRLIPPESPSFPISVDYPCRSGLDRIRSFGLRTSALVSVFASSVSSQLSISGCAFFPDREEFGLSFISIPFCFLRCVKRILFLGCLAVSWTSSRRTDERFSLLDPMAGLSVFCAWLRPLP